MRITYHVTNEGDFAVTTAKTVAPLWGRWCILTLTSYRIEEDTAITFGFRGAEPDEIQSDPLVAVPDGIFRLSESWDGGYRIVEQELVVPRLHGWILDPTDLRDGGVEAGRTLCASLFRTYESLLETVRQTIRRNIAAPIRSRFIGALQGRFAKPTSRMVRRLLSDIHWRLMLNTSTCGDNCVGVIEYTFSHDPLHYHELADESPVNIPLLIAEDTHLDQEVIADRRALALLRRVCGDAMAEELRTTGRITIHAGGYRFEIAPMSFVRCTDPNGRSAELCIYSAGLRCNPIDELVLAHLCIKHKLPEYMQTANVFRPDPGFQRDPVSATDLQNSG